MTTDVPGVLPGDVWRIGAFSLASLRHPLLGRSQAPFAQAFLTSRVARHAIPDVAMRYHRRVLFATTMTWPILTLSIVLLVLSLILLSFILLHKGRGGGMSDLFGGGMSTAMGGTSSAERTLDRITIVVGVLWVAGIIGLLVLYHMSGTAAA